MLVFHPIHRNADAAQPFRESAISIPLCLLVSFMLLQYQRYGSSVCRTESRVIVAMTLVSPATAVL